MRAGPDLVIFDCDGVLVDSEPISLEVLRSVITELGGDISEALAYERFLGRSMASISEVLRDEFNLTFGPAELERVRTAVLDRFRLELKPVDGIREALLALTGPRAVASSSQLERIRLSLEVAGILDLLEPNIFSASMVSRGKPAPDLFLHVATLLQVEPQACLVIEDSPAGIAAAKAAGMRVFGFVGGSHAARAGLVGALEAIGPDLVFDDMRLLPTLLAKAAGAAGRISATRRRGPEDPAERLVCAVDVGTGSARAGILDGGGRLLGRAEHPIRMHRPEPGHAEHDSEDIWRAACAAVRAAVRASGVGSHGIEGICFDATCSLVVRDRHGMQLSVSRGGAAGWDTIAWMDHRAVDEADRCTATGHCVLGYVGGVMSPEMQIPKLMWIRNHLPQIWARAGLFFDLTDFLSWKACGSTARDRKSTRLNSSHSSPSRMPSSA